MLRCADIEMLVLFYSKYNSSDVCCPDCPFRARCFSLSSVRLTWEMRSVAIPALLHLQMKPCCTISWLVFFSCTIHLTLNRLYLNVRQLPWEICVHLVYVSLGPRQALGKMGVIAWKWFFGLVFGHLCYPPGKGKPWNIIWEATYAFSSCPSSLSHSDSDAPFPPPNYLLCHLADDCHKAQSWTIQVWWMGIRQGEI